MEENQYDRLVAQTFRALEGSLADVDPDLVEVTSTGDVVTLAFPKGIRCVINTQRAARQIWMAVKDEAWHFSYDHKTNTWVDDRGRGIELRAKLGEVVAQFSGVQVTFR